MPSSFMVVVVIEGAVREELWRSWRSLARSRRVLWRGMAREGWVRGISVSVSLLRAWARRSRRVLMEWNVDGKCGSWPYYSREEPKFRSALGPSVSESSSCSLHLCRI